MRSLKHAAWSLRLELGSGAWTLELGLSILQPEAGSLEPVACGFGFGFCIQQPGALGMDLGFEAWNLQPGAWGLPAGARGMDHGPGTWAWSLEPAAWSLGLGTKSLEPRPWCLVLANWSLEPGAYILRPIWA